jgi:hypothetical protein
MDRIALDGIAPLAFVSHSDPAMLEIRVNFGLFAGREVTPAELDELVAALVPAVGHVSIVAEHRVEADDGAEAVVHQVRIEIPGEELPEPGDHLEETRQKVLDAVEQWAQACIAERRVEAAEL